MDWLRCELRAAQPRRAFRLSSVGLINEWLRAVSYAAAPAVDRVVGGAGPEATTVAILSIPALGLAVAGIRSGGRRPQATSAFVDLAVGPVVVALISGSPGLGWVTALIISGLVAATYSMSVRLFALAIGAGSVTTSMLSPLVGGARDESARVALAVLVVGALAFGATLLVAGWWRGHRSLKRKEQELASILDNAPVMVATVDDAGRLASLAGRAPDDSWEVGATLPIELLQLVERSRAGAVSADVRMGSRWVAFTATPGRHGVTLTGCDVTDRETARSNLEDLIASKDRFVASISHELRTPLTAVLGFAEQLRQSEALVDEDREYIELVAQQSAEMAGIIEDLLVVVRADLDLLALNRKPIDLTTEAEAVCRGLHPRLRRSMFLDLGDAKAAADPMRVRHIVRNLVTNADRYGGERLVVATRSDGGVAVVEVRDDGPPIPVDRVERMFRPYESEGRDRGMPSAIGLGLAVSRRLAELMGGTLMYRHEDGWSIFRLELPSLAQAT